MAATSCWSRAPPRGRISAWCCRAAAPHPARRRGAAATPGSRPGSRAARARAIAVAAQPRPLVSFAVFRFFESLIEPTGLVPAAPPPSGLAGFYWHFARQVRGVVAALFLVGFCVGLLDTTIPVFIGRVVGLVSTYPRAGFWGEA